MTATDNYVGLVLDELDALGFTNDTTTVIFGDQYVERVRLMLI